MNEVHNPLLVNARGYRVVETRCDGEDCDGQPGLYTLKNAREDDTCDETWARVPKATTEAMGFEFELMFEVEKVPRNKRPPAHALGRKELVGTIRFLL